MPQYLAVTQVLSGKRCGRGPPFLGQASGVGLDFSALGWGCRGCLLEAERFPV